MVAVAHTTTNPEGVHTVKKYKICEAEGRDIRALDWCSSSHNGGHWQRHAGRVLQFNVFTKSGIVFCPLYR